MNYQDFCVEMVTKALNIGASNQQLASVSYKYALKAGLIRIYSETYEHKEKEFKFWNLDFGSNTWKGKEVWKNLLCSKNAYDLCDKIENKKIPYAKDNKPYYEHIEPVKVTYENICKLNNKNAKPCQVRSILDNSKIIILDREEYKYLDSKEYNKFCDKDLELVIKWYESGHINDEQKDNTINSMIKNGKYLNTSDNGTSLARIAHLINNGVEFTWGINPNLQGIDLIISYLKCSSHVCI